MAPFHIENINFIVAYSVERLIKYYVENLNPSEEFSQREFNKFLTMVPKFMYRFANHRLN